MWRKQKGASIILTQTEFLRNVEFGQEISSCRRNSNKNVCDNEYSTNKLTAFHKLIPTHFSHYLKFGSYYALVWVML